MMINQSLRLLREYSAISQAEMARIIGISQSYLSEIENAKKDVTLELLKTYSEHLNVPLSSLLFFVESLDGAPIPTRGRIIVARKILKLLQDLMPDDVEQAENRSISS